MSTILREKSMAMMVSERQPWRFGIGLEGGQVDDRHVRHVGGELAHVRTDQEVADEERVPGIFREDARPHPVGRIGAAVEVLREQLHAFGMLDEILKDDVELLRRQRTVVVPPDLVLGRGVADRVLVLRRAAGMDARVGVDGAALDELRLAARDRVLVEAGSAEVPMHALEVAEAERVSAVRAVEDAEVLHGRNPPGAIAS